MTEPVLIKIAYVLAAVIVYGLLRWRLMLATHEFRVRVACEADRWAEDPRVNPKIRISLAGLADAAYRPATPWLILIGLTVSMCLPLHRTRIRLSDVSDDAGVAAQIFQLKLKLLFALITTSPSACVLAMIVLMIGLLVHKSVITIKDSVSAAGDRFFPSARIENLHSA